MYFILFLKTKLVTIEVRELCKKLYKNLEIQPRLRRSNIFRRITQLVLIFSGRITGTSTPPPVSLSSTALGYGSRAASLAFERKIESTLFKRPVHFAQCSLAFDAKRRSLTIPYQIVAKFMARSAIIQRSDIKCDAT